MSDHVICHRVKEVLDATGIKQSHLAEKLGIHPQAMSRLLNSDISRSKHFPGIAKALGVTEEFLISGNKKPVLCPTDNELIRLVTHGFKPTEHDRKKAKDFLVKTQQEGFYFAYELKVDIDPIFKTGNIVIFSSNLAQKNAGAVYIALSAVSQSFIVGKYAADGGKAFITNENGVYLIQDKDTLVGQAIQVMVYLES